MRDYKIDAYGKTYVFSNRWDWKEADELFVCAITQQKTKAEFEIMLKNNWIEFDSMPQKTMEKNNGK